VYRHKFLGTSKYFPSAKFINCFKRSTSYDCSQNCFQHFILAL